MSCLADAQPLVKQIKIINVTLRLESRYIQNAVRYKALHVVSLIERIVFINET